LAGDNKRVESIHSEMLITDKILGYSAIQQELMQFYMPASRLLRDKTGRAKSQPGKAALL
jgi:hypothetical protein